VSIYDVKMKPCMQIYKLQILDLSFFPMTIDDGDRSCIKSHL